jgi:predicted DNA-binding antitoxin AbrB/MazE fold protein
VAPVEVCYDRCVKDTLKAVFENGVFRPLRRPKGLTDRREVTLTVTVEEDPSSLADFAGRVSSDDAQEMRDVIEREFERVDPREWR